MLDFRKETDMTTSISIHPQHGDTGALSFKATNQFRAENSNAVNLVFSSREFGGRQNVEQIIYFYRLSATDAEILASVGLLDAPRREALLPVLRHMLAEMAAEAEVENA